MIGVFDSGVGGLTVLRALRERMPQEDFVYLGDTARLPYGTKSPATIRRYLEQNIKFLRQFPVRAIVVACNSASSVLEPGEAFSVPVYDVIGPGAEAACRASVGGKIAVLGTRATVSGGAYLARIRKLRPEALVQQIACPLFVSIVEEGLEDDPIADRAAELYLSGLTGVDTVILGCTYYPVLKRAIACVLGPDVLLVDSAETLATALQSQPGKPERGETRLHVTDASPAFLETAQRLYAPFGFASADLADLGSPTVR